MLWEFLAPGGGNLCCLDQPLVSLRHAGGDHGADDRSDSASDSSERNPELWREDLKVGERSCSKSSSDAAMDELSYMSSMLVVRTTQDSKIEDAPGTIFERRP